MSNKAPKVDPVSWIVFLISLLAIVAVVYVLLSNLISTYKRNSVKGDIDTSQLVMKVEENLKPIGISSTSDAPAAGAAGRGGKEIYDAVCTSCHATGVLDSPKFGDKAAWEARAAGGLDALVASAAKGKGAMPAKGGDPSLSDAELRAVVLYMTKESGLDLGSAEPAAPAKEAPKEEMKTKPKAEEAATADVIPAEAKAPEAPATPAAPAVAVAPVAAAAPTAVPSIDGKKVYDTACFACHASGVAGSPKLGDKEAWVARIATGMDALYTTALKGKGAMPPKGGNMSLPDADVKAAVDYMVEQSK
jgi:cytochrome c5